MGKNKKAQVSIFIIVAIVIVAIGLILFYVFGGGGFVSSVPQEIEPVYTYYISCIEEEVIIGKDLLAFQGGRIAETEFSPGSNYMPFSSHLGFMGYGVPYWSYITGNGIIQEDVPTNSKMKSELDLFLRESQNNCDFSEFREKGFEIILGDKKFSSEINEDNIIVEVDQEISIKFGEFQWSRKNHQIEVKSSVGKLHEISRDIYEKEKNEDFLENYGVDILRLYAPVDGTEISCTPKIWSVDEIHTDLVEALEGNTASLKIKGDYYDLIDKENEYFVTELDNEIKGVGVNFIFSRNFPHKLEVWPNEGDILRADPIGLQEGLGVLGFCYVPYHFVYDLYYPILIQVSSGEEIFQFPVVVIIDKNKPKEALETQSVPGVVPELCKNKNTDVTVYTYNKNLEPVEADISFRCFDTTCPIGRTKLVGNDAILTEKFPQCVNGFIISREEGFSEDKFQLTTIESSSAIIVLEQEYEINVDLKASGQSIDEESFVLISFEKDSKTQTISYPEQKTVTLSSGQYDIRVYQYSETEINLEGSSSEKCIDVPRSGFLGLFGSTEEKCFELEIPDQTVSNSVSGGGTEKYFITDTELENSNRILIEFNDFGIPDQIEELQLNYNKIEISSLNINFL